MKRNQWYSIAQSTDDELLSRVSFSLGEATIIFDVIIQYETVSLGWVDVSVPEGFFSVRVRRYANKHYVDVLVSLSDDSTPQLTISNILNTLRILDMSVAVEGNAICLITTEDYVPSKDESHYVTLDTVQFILARKYFTDGFAIGDESSSIAFTLQGGEIYVGGRKLFSDDDFSQFATKEWVLAKGYAYRSELPTNLSDLNNDLISSWALASVKPSYTYSEIGGTPDIASMIATALVGYATQAWVTGQGYLTHHQTIYALTVKRNGTTIGTYEPALQSAELNITVPTNLTDLTNDLIPAWALASTKPTYNYSEIINAPSKLSDLTDDIVSGFYLPLSGGTISGNLSVANTLEVIGSLIIPTTAPVSPQTGKTYFYFSSTGSYAESGGGGVADVYKLYLQRNGVQVGVFDAGGADATINIEVPTKVSELLNDAGYLTQHQSLANYYTKTEVNNLIPDMSAYLPKTYTKANYGTASIGWGANGQLTINGSQYTNLNSPLLIYAGASANFMRMYAMLNGTATEVGYVGYHSAAFRLFNSRANKGLGVRDNGTPAFYTSATNYVELWHKGNLTNVSQLNNDAGYLTQHQSLADYINNGAYNSTTKRIELRHGSTVISSIDATEFIKDGMVDSVTVENGYIIIVFNTDSGKEPISIPITDIFDASLYYTKTETANIFATKAMVGALKLSDLTDDILSGHYLPLSGGTINGGLVVNGLLDASVSLVVPTVAPANPLSGKTYFYFSSTGSYAESGGGGVADVYKLYLKRNNVQIGVFDAGAQDATINIEVPTKVGELINDAGYVTSTALTAILVSYAQVADLPTKVSDLNNDRGFVTLQEIIDQSVEMYEAGFFDYALEIVASDVAAHYYSQLQINTMLASYALKSELPTKVSDLNNDLSFVTNSDLSTALASYVTSSALATTLADYALISSLPTNLTDLTNDLIPAWALASTKPTYNYSEIVDAPDVSSMISTALTGYSTTTEIGTMLSAYLPLSGGVMTGAITWGGNNTCLAFANTAGTKAFNLISLRNTTSASPYIDIGQWVTEADSANRSLIAMGGYQYNIYFGYRDNADNYIQLASTGQLSRLRSMTPLATNTYNLGTVALSWANIYTQYLNLANGGSLRGYSSNGSVYVMLSPNTSGGMAFGNANWAHLSYQANTFMVFQVRENNVWRTPLRIEGSEIRTWTVRPATNNTYDIGTTTYQYVNGYIKNIIASESVKTATAEVSTNLAIPTTAPTNPDSSKVYLYFSATGVYAE